MNRIKDNILEFIQSNQAEGTLQTIVKLMTNSTDELLSDVQPSFNSDAAEKLGISLLLQDNSVYLQKLLASVQNTEATSSLTRGAGPPPVTPQNFTAESQMASRAGENIQAYAQTSETTSTRSTGSVVTSTGGDNHRPMTVFVRKLTWTSTEVTERGIQRCFQALTQLDRESSTSERSCLKGYSTYGGPYRVG